MMYFTFRAGVGGVTGEGKEGNFFFFFFFTPNAVTFILYTKLPLPKLLITIHSRPQINPNDIFSGLRGQTTPT
jgi:hypothetical protein